MKKTVWQVLLLFLLSGCMPIVKQYPDTTSTAIILSTSTNTLHLATQVHPTPSPIPITPITSVTEKCIEITTAPRSKSSGVLVFWKRNTRSLTLVDNQSNTQRLIPASLRMEVDLSSYVSPDRKWLFYNLGGRDENGLELDAKYIFAKSDGSQQKELPYDKRSILSESFWLNDHNLRLVEMDVAASSIQSFAFDPFSETKSLLRSDFPSLVSNENIDWAIDQEAISMGLLKNTNIIYDPSLVRVLYPKENGQVSLYNIETNTEIAQTSITGWGRLPQWSPDGKNLTIVGTMSSSPNTESLDELLIISRDGTNFEQLTSLTSIFQSIHIEEYRWSLDGQKIAFWLKTDKTESASTQNHLKLAVLDLQTAEITNYCIAGSSTIEDDGIYETYPLIWSPDGSALLLGQLDHVNAKTIDNILVDFVNNTAYKVAQGLVPIGWMTKEP